MIIRISFVTEQDVRWHCWLEAEQRRLLGLLCFEIELEVFLCAIRKERDYWDWYGTSSVERLALLVARIEGDSRLVNHCARLSFQAQCLRKV
jgi:hypothetical protein